MGRKKGSKNKPRVDKANIDPLNDTPVQSNVVPIIANTKTEVKVKTRKDNLPADLFGVLTKTVYGTPIAIVGICGSKGYCDLMVIPNYKERISKTTINSKSVIRPKFDDPEIEKEFEDIQFYVAPVLPETVTQSPDTVTEVPMAITSSPDSTTLGEASK